MMLMLMHLRSYRFMSDLVIGLLQDLSAHLISTSCCHATHPTGLEMLYDELPQSMLRDGAVDSVDRCFLGEDFKGLENGKQVRCISHMGSIY